MSAMAWDDERPGLSIPASALSSNQPWVFAPSTSRPALISND